MILITGANGQTGRAIIKQLLSKGQQVRALVHRPESAKELDVLGVQEVVVGDMLDQKDMDEAFTGISAAYHICSALNPHEVEIGQVMIKAARTAQIGHLVYHSVLHSVLQDMPHHQKKLTVEKLLVDSGIPYTIVQPAVFMQNILEFWRPLTEEGIFRQKFFTNTETRMCMIDLEDLAVAASIILTTPGNTGATYELCGPDNLSLLDMVSVFEQHFGREIEVDTPPDEMFASQLKKHGAGDYQVDTLLKMFQHYNVHGFVGNPNVISWILGRKPNDFSSFVLKAMNSKK